MESSTSTAQFASGKAAFGRNLLSNISLLAVNLGVGIWFVPYLLSELGEIRYGYLPVAVNLMSFLAIATGAYMIAACRRLTVSLEEEPPEGAGQVFNSTFFPAVAAGLFLLVPCSMLSLQPQWFLNIPDALVREVRLLFGFSSVGLFCSTLSIPFQIVSQSRNRLDLFNGVLLLHRITRILLTIGLFVWVSPTLSSAGLAILVSGLVELSGHVACWKRLGRTLRISRNSFSRDVFVGLGKQSGWIMFAMLGAFFFYGLDAILVNRLLGPESTTHYAIAVQWAILLKMGAAALAGVMHPTITRTFTSDDRGSQMELIQRSLKFVGYFVAVVAGILCGFSRPFLALWLGPEFTHLAPLIVLLIAPAAVIQCAHPMFSAAIATDRMRFFGIVTVSGGVVATCLLVLFVRGFGWGIMGAASALIGVTLVINVILTPRYTASGLGMSPVRLFSGIAKVGIASLLCWAVAAVVERFVLLHSWPRLCFIAAGLSLLYLTTIYFVGLNRHDRTELRTWLAA